MSLIKEKELNTFTALKSAFSYRNKLESPRLIKVVISVGVGKVAKEKNKLAVVEDRLARITGQKPAPRGAKKSIATFKTRQGDIVGYQVTLRGARMYDFLDKLVHVALPRTRDFRGLSRDAFDDMGNYTVGIREHTIFPETSDEELVNVFGMAITVVTSTNNKDEARAFLEHLGFPLKK